MSRYLAIFAAALAAFGTSLRGGFHLDDFSLFSNPVVTQVSGFWRVWTVFQPRPLTYLTFWANYQVGGQNPLLYHAVNLLLHAAVSLLLYRALLRLIPPRAAFFSAFLFAIHPAAAEPVAYIFARSSLLATLLCLLSLLAWLDGRTRIAIGCFGLALLAKEECVAFPLFLVLLEVSRRGWDRTKRQPVIIMLGLAFLAGVRVAASTRVIHGAAAGFASGLSPVEYAASQGLAILRYLQLALVPWGFTIEPAIPTQPWWLEALGWLAVAGLALLAWKRFRRLREGFWLLGGLLLLLPSSSFFPADDLAADRRMYLLMLAFVVPFGLFTQTWWRWSPALPACGLIALSVLRMEVWRNETVLWTEAMTVSPGKIRPIVQLARAAPASEALDLMLRAKSIAPNDPAIAADLGLLWLRTSQPVAALREFGRQVALRPGDPNGLNNRGAALLALRQTEAARHDFEAALNTDPCLATARRNLRSIGGIPPVCATEK